MNKRDLVPWNAHLNPDTGMWSKRYHFKIFLSFLALVAILFSNLGREKHEEHFSEIILNLIQWFRICRLKIFLSKALVAL